jgi:hypothetical protein
MLNPKENDDGSIDLIEDFSEGATPPAPDDKRFDNPPLPQSPSNDSEGDDEGQELSLPDKLDEDEKDVELSAYNDIIEKEARRRGWESPEERAKRGLKPGVSAMEFVHRGQYISQDPKKLARMLTEKDQDITRLQEAVSTHSAEMKKFQDFHARQLKLERAKTIRELTEERNKALVDEGDEDKAGQLDDRIRLVKNEMEADAATPSVSAPAGKEMVRNVEIPPGAVPEFKRFIEETDWFGTDVKKTEFAKAFAAYLTNSGAGKEMSNADFYKTVKDRTEKEFQTHKPPVISGKRGGGETRPGKTRTFADLAPDDRKVARRMIENSGISETEYMGTLEGTGYFAEK